MKNITIQEQYREIAEAGDMHNKDCCVNFEDGRACDVGEEDSLECCENMRWIKKQMLIAEKRGMLNKMEEKKKGGMPWRAETDEKYWLVSHYGRVIWDNEDDCEYDNFCYTHGNYFRTKQEAQAHLTYLQALGKVRLAILEANGNWKSEWDDSEYKYKYYIRCDYGHDDGDRFHVSLTTWIKHPFTLPYIRTEEIAEQIIKDYKEELLVIFKKK